ncbi:MAG: DUF192 domain-containing protein [Desulfobacterota bacterium]|nr:DUF192 domain-containing protein [Thermodesulfobacteriota bacterium]
MHPRADGCYAVLRRTPSCAWYGAVWFLAAVLVCCTQQPEVVFHARSGELVRVTVETAQTPVQRSLGLMYRTELPVGRGMLFITDHEAVQSFTMRNTSIPLDMIFIGSDMRVVGIIENAQPFHEGPFAIGTPSRYVLEVPAGFCRRRGISRGDVVRFINITL